MEEQLLTEPIIVNINTKPTTSQGEALILPSEIRTGEFQDLQPEGADFGLLSGMNQQYNRASSQSWTDQLGNFVVQAGAEVIGGTIEGIGYLGDFQQHANLIRGTEQEFGNWLSNYGKQLKEATSEAFPIYEEDPNSFNPSDTGWWFKNGVSVASSLSLLIPARGATSLLGRVGKALGAESALIKTASLIGKKGEDLSLAIQAAKQNTKGITAAILSRTMENTMEASQSFDEVYQKRLAEGYSEEQARLDAAQVGREVWYNNSALLLQDIPQYMFIFKAPGLLASQGKQVQKMFGQASLKDYGLTMLSEGLEEGVQNVIGQEAKGRVLDKEFASMSFEERLANYVKEPEFINSVIFGALGGGLAAVVGRKLENIQAKNYIIKEDAAIAQAQGKENLVNQVKDTSTREVIVNNLDNLDRVKSELNDISQEEGAANKVKQVLSDVEIAEQVKNDFIGKPEYLPVVIDLSVASNQAARRIGETEANIEKLKSVPAIQEHIKKNGEESFQFALNTNLLKNLNKFRSKFKNDPYVLSAINGLEKQYQQNLDNIDGKYNIALPIVAQQLNQLSNNLIENQIEFESKNNKAQDIINNKTEWVDEQLANYKKNEVSKETNVDKLNELQGVEDEVISKAAKNRLNELYKNEDKNVPDDINNLPQYYTNNPVTFLRDKRDLYNISAATTIEEFSALINTPEFQEQFNTRKENKSTETKVENKKKEVEEEVESISETPQKDIETETKEQVDSEVEEDTSNLFIASQEQQHQEDETIGYQKEWQDVNANKLRTADAITYSYDDGLYSIPLLGKVKTETKDYRLTEEEFNQQYKTGNKTKGYHVLYDKEGNVVFYQEDLIDKDFIRNFFNKVDSKPYTTPITLHINGNYVNGNFKNNEQPYDKVQIEARVGNKVIGKLPATHTVHKLQRGKFDALRKQIYNAWKESGQVEYQYPVSTNITKILNGRFWQGLRTVDISSITNEPIILGLAKNGQLIIPDVDEKVIPQKKLEELQNKFNVTNGNVYWLIKSPITGEYVPYRLFTKKVKSVGGKTEQLQKILSEVNPSNVIDKRREVQEIIRWKDSKDAIQPDFFYTKEGKLIAKLEGFTQEFQSPIELFDAYDMSDKTLQVSEVNLNSRNFNDVLIKQGYFEATLNPGLFHSPSFIIDLEKLYDAKISKPVGITRGKPKFSIKSDNKVYPVANIEEETKWFKEKLGEVVDLNVVSEEELDSLVESLKHIHGQDNLKAWGFFHNAAVWISRNAPNNVLKHESFHLIFTLALTEQQQKALLNSVTEKQYTQYLKNYPDINDAKEEYLADKFYEYVQLAQVSEEQLKQTSFFKQLGSRLQRYFRKLWLSIKANIGLNLSQEEIFFRIQSSSYKNFKPKREGSEQFKPSVKAYANPIKQKDRVNMVNWYFLERFNKFKEEWKKKNPELNERELTKMAVDVKSQYNIFKELSTYFREMSEAALVDDRYSVEENQYVSTEYREIADKLWEEDGYGQLFEDVVQDLKRYGIRVKMLKEDVEVQEDEDTKEMWMEVTSSPLDSFTQQLKQGLGLLIDANFTDNKALDENGFREVKYAYDDIGHQRSIDIDYAYNTLMEHTHGSLSVEDMMNKIKDMTDSYPWAIQLYQVLNGNIEPTSIPNPEWFKTQLYFIGPQNPAPIPKYLLEMWTKPEPGIPSKKLWILSNSTVRGLSDRLKKEWLSNISNPKYNRLLNAKGEINKDKVRDIQQRLKNKKNDYKLIHNVLNGIGINIPIEAVEKIVVAKANLQDLAEKLFGNIEDNGVVNGVVESIANLAKKYYKEYHQSSHSNVEGETVQNYIRNSFMARQIEKFRRGDVAFYRVDPYYEQNNNTKSDGSIDTNKDLWLDRFETDARKKLEFAIVDGTKYVNGQSTLFPDMSPIEFLSYSMNAYYNNGGGIPKSGNKYVGKAFYSAQLMADSASHALIGFESYTNEVILDKLVEVALREYNAILEHKRNPVAIKGNNPVFKLIPGLTEEDFNPLRVDVLRNRIKGSLDKLVKKQIEEYTRIGFFEKKEDKLVSEHLDSRIGDVEEFMTNFIYNDYYAQTQIVSLFHGKLFMYKSMEDFYKRAKEIWSPGNFINAELEGVNKEFFSIFVESQMFDYSNNKNVIDTIMSNMRKVGIDENIVLTTGAKYGYTDGTMIGNKKGVTLPDGSKVVSGQTDATDAQGIIDIHRWREISLGKGIDPVEVERIYNAILNDTYTITDLTIVLNPFKQFYYQLNQVSTDKGTVIVPTQIKNSEYVLIPQIAKGNPELEKILEKLDGIRKSTGLNGSINFNSAVKVGERNTYKTIEDIDNYSVRLLNSEYRIQGEVPEHQVEAENRLGTQLRKLIVGDLDLEGIYDVNGQELNGKEIKEEWNKLLVADIKEKAVELKRAFKNDVEFYKMLQNEALSRDYPDKFIKALTLVDGKPRMPLFSPLLYKKSVALISSIYRNRITKLDFPGASLPNAVSYGLKREPEIVFNEDGSIKYFEAYMPLTHKKLAKYMDKEGILDTSLLEKLGLDLGVAYRIPTENKYSMVPIKIIGFTNAGIILPKEITTIAGLDFDIDKMYVMLYSFEVVDGKLVKSKWEDNPKYEDYERRILRSKEAKDYLRDKGVDITQFIGETQTYNLLEEIGGITEDFFDKGYTIDDLLLNSLEQDAVMLSEAEWNKLNVYEKNSKGARNNRKLDIVRSVLTNAHTVEAQLVPGGFAELEAEANRIANIKGLGKDNINPMSLLSRLEIFKRMMAGKKLIGIPANYNATHALMQGSGMELAKPVLFNGVEGKDLGLKYIMGSDITVTSEIAQFLASVVDNGKNPLANLYNLNLYTADVAMLITKFFGKEVAMRFIAQPIVTEFYERYINEGGDSKAEIKVATELLDMYKKDYFNMLKEGDINIDNTQLENGLKDKYNGVAQKEILKQFLRYKKNQAKDLGTLVNAIKVPDNGMRSTLEKTITGVDRVKEARALSLIAGTNEFFDNIEYANNTLYTEGIEEGLSKFVELGFPNFLEGAYINLRDYFSGQKGSNLDERELTLLHDTAFSYMSAGFEPLSNLDIEKVVKETPTLLKAFKGTNPIAYSKLINSLKVDKSEIDEDYEIITLDSGLSKDAENDIMNQWEQLVYSPVEEEKKLGLSLVEYAFISNGFRFSPGSLSHIQPISFYENLMDSTNKSYNDFIAQQIQSANQDERFLEAFKEQFIRHYFPRLSFVKSYSKDTAFIRYDEKTKEPYNVTLDEFQDSLTDREGNKIMPDYIKVRDENTRKWYLFKNDGGINYHRINTLGMYREFEEWSFGIQKSESIFKTNNMSKTIMDKFDEVKETGFAESTAKTDIGSSFDNFKQNFNTTDC